MTIQDIKNQVLLYLYERRDVSGYHDLGAHAHSVDIQDQYYQDLCLALKSEGLIDAIVSKDSIEARITANGIQRIEPNVNFLRSKITKEKEGWSQNNEGGSQNIAVASLSFNEVDLELLNEGMRNRGCVGFAHKDRQTNTIPLHAFKLHKPVDFFFTTNVNHENFRYRNAENRGIFCQVYKEAEESNNLIKLQRFLRKKGVAHIFLSNPKIEALVNLGFKPEGDNIYLHKVQKQGTLPVYAYHSFNEDLFAPIEIETEVRRDKQELGKPLEKSVINFRDRNQVDPVLGAQDLAKELAHLILKMPPEKGCMIGIFGKWGRGKTFLMDKTWELLEGKISARVTFHAWKYQDTPAIWAYLYEQFTATYFETKWHKKIWRQVYLNYKRIGSRELIVFILLFSASAFWAYGFSFERKIEIVGDLLKSVGTGVVISTALLYFRYGKTALSLFRKYYSRLSFAKFLGIQAEVQKEFAKLLNAWPWRSDEDKVVLFVDDIDRCSEEKVIQIIDALRVMLEDDEIAQRLIIVTAIDERILKKAIKIKYEQLLNFKMPDPNSNYQKELNQLANEYIDKLFIAGLKLSDLSARERDEFFVEFSKNDRRSKEVDGFSLIQSGKPKVIDSIAANQSLIAVRLDEPGANSEGRPSEPIKNTQSSLQQEKLLSNEEINLIRTSLMNFHGSTPRRIRIFYYRYLIAKNLLERQYLRLGKPNIWQIPEYTKVLLEQIRQYSQEDDRDRISEQRLRVIESTEDPVSIDGIVLSLKKEDYCELLKALDVVIAY